MTRVVIDIPDEDFTLLCEAFGEVELKSTLNLRLQSAVAHGRVLPEGHGDLIDRKALTEALKSGCDFCGDINTNWCERCCPHNDFEDLIDEAPTVIEADKEKADENS